MNELETLAKNLRHHRQVKGMQQKDLAAKIGLSKDTISKIETGKQENVGLKYLSAMCRELNISIEELFLEDPKKLRIEIVASAKGIEALKEIARQFKIVS
ncbi:hypothetical protein ES707_04989 [subsurface metagenome]